MRRGKDGAQVAGHDIDVSFAIRLKQAFANGLGATAVGHGIANKKELGMRGYLHGKYKT